ncbi:MAG: polysaccharide biosynthesis protein [Planctomycetes bacterium]|nr:polysaccharide biosynthesis protein [Planctomycetota bacterium]
MARAAGREHGGEFARTLTSSLSLALFLTIPSAVGLAVLGEPIIALVYERGRFDGADTIATAQALACYALGLVGYSLIKILAPAFYAVDDAKTPARVSLASIAVNFGLCALFVGPFGHQGLALSTSIVATANAVLLFVLLRRLLVKRRADTLRAAPLLRTIAKVLFASAAMAAVCLFVGDLLERWLGLEHVPQRLGVVLGSIACGGAVYIGVCALLCVGELEFVRSRWLRRRRA